jgi:hypothetical protein
MLQMVNVRNLTKKLHGNSFRPPRAQSEGSEILPKFSPVPSINRTSLPASRSRTQVRWTSPVIWTLGGLKALSLTAWPLQGLKLVPTVSRPGKRGFKFVVQPSRSWTSYSFLFPRPVVVAKSAVANRSCCSFSGLFAWSGAFGQLRCPMGHHVQTLAMVQP